MDEAETALVRIEGKLDTLVELLTELLDDDAEPLRQAR